MAKFDCSLRKEIVRNLHAAIDSELSKNEKEAYKLYVESLKLVTEAFKKDATGCISLSIKEKQNLIEFAQQSLNRMSLIVGKEEGVFEQETMFENTQVRPSAPDENSFNTHTSENSSPNKFYFKKLKECDDERQNLILRYYRRIEHASTSQEKQNLELELARQLVEQAAIMKNRMIQATALSMDKAHKKFNIESKLKGGTLRESDFKKQQLYALCLQFTEDCSYLKNYLKDLSAYPNNEKIVREFLHNIFTDNFNPVKCSLTYMHSKVQNMIPLENHLSDINSYVNNFNIVSEEIKEDLNIIIDVLKTLYDPLYTDRNLQITAEVVNHFYFAPLKFPLISLIRKGLKGVEDGLMVALERQEVDLNTVSLNEFAKQEAITKLHYMLTLHNPYDMINCIVHVIKLLATCEFDKNHFTSIGADELLPRLCLVIAESRIVSLGAEAKFIETFMPSDKALGEEGYATTILQSAIAHLTITEA